jgi:hypothetical protein
MFLHPFCDENQSIGQGSVLLGAFADRDSKLQKSHRMWVSELRKLG